MFIERGPNDVIIYVGDGHILKHTISNGDSVTLISGDESVLVRDVLVLSPGQFSGTIYGFEPSFATEYKGLELDQRIEFAERHIFGCNSA